MSHFRTVKISDPRFPADDLQFVTVKSEHLKGRGDICLWVPDYEDLKDVPIVLLLHGVYGSAWSWALNAGAHLTAKRLITEGVIKPMIIAMPSDGLWGDGSGYLPHTDVDYEQWIVQDVPQAVREVIPAVGNTRSTYICGLSMGGFGALRIGAKYGGRFHGMSGHSSITSLDQMKLFVEEGLGLYRQERQEDEDVFLTIHENRDQLSPFRFDCGKDDLLIEHNRMLHTRLVDAQIDHTYEEFEGSHEWPYWEEHLEKSLIFFDKIHNRSVQNSSKILDRK